MIPKKIKVALSQLGFSLIEIVIAATLLSFMSLAFSIMITQMSKDLTNVSLKNEVLSTEVLITHVLTDSQKCTPQVLDRVFNATVVAGVSIPTNSNAIRLVPASGPPTNIVIEGTAIGGHPKSHIVSKIAIENLIRLTPDSFKAELVVETTPPTVGALTFRPLSIPIFFRTDPTSPNTAKRILSCGQNSGSLDVNCNIREKISLSNTAHTHCCEDAEVLISAAAPEDPVNSSFDWINKKCSRVRSVEPGNRIQLLCCP